MNRNALPTTAEIEVAPQHTPGRLVIGYGGQPGDDYATITSPRRGVPLAEITSHNHRDDPALSVSAAEANANARRLVAAWNAVEGVPTEALDAGVVKALLAACRRARGWFSQFGYNRYGIAVADDAPDPEEVVRELRAALALALAEPEGDKAAIAHHGLTGE